MSDMSTPATDRPTVLVVDDTPANLSLLSNLLKSDYRVKLANNGAKALELATTAPPDLILLDIMMPGMDGYEVCRRLKAEEATRLTPVIFLTAKTDIEDEEQGFAVGAVDFIHKPISPPIVAARVRAQLAIKSWQNFLRNQNLWLQQEVERRLTQIHRLQDASIFVMVSLAEFRDLGTGNHIRRTQDYVRILAQGLSRLPNYAQRLTAEQIELIAKTAPLHDIGKIAIPDQVLLKPGRLTEEEFAVIQTHSELGNSMLCTAGEHLGEENDFLTMARVVARSHHEKWDGSGYPQGLAGEEIPLAARIMAVADVFDALITKRPYKTAMTYDQAAEVIRAGRGKHFDPMIVDVFEEAREDFERIFATWTDA